jgi:hypothetical protein
MTGSSGLPVPLEERLVAGRYRIESALGKGGMGAVYAVVDTTSGTRLALKRASATASPTMLELFKREFHTLHGLRHPNIIEVYDYGVDRDGPFYTMELLVGSDLGRAAPLSWRDVCSYLRQVATLLGLLHARRLVHRDVTPRNIWVLPDGRIKLIDFGALCPFGVPSEVVGTPPFIAPEWLHDRAASVVVDQRADLYALGALAYWLLTSVHAYPARSLSDLPRAWTRDPAPPSTLAKLVSGRELEPIPPALDALVGSLLRQDPAARPKNTERIIDAIDAIAGPPSETVDHAVRGYVHSKLFVGRSSALRRIARDVSASHNRGAASTVVGAHGIGRSRLLEEACVRCHLSGATAVLARGADSDRSYGVADAIALGLLDSLPAEARKAALPHATVLAQLSVEVQRRLDVTGQIAREATSQGRERLQSALTEWLFALAAERPLAVLIDDLQSSDEESAAWLAALALQCRSRRLVLVAAVVEEPGTQLPLHVQMFRNAGHVIELAPLNAHDVHQLLESVFGPVAYLSRVTEPLFRASQGNPAHCLELVEFLVENAIARYSEGTWILPGHLSEGELPQSRSDMHSARLAHIGEHARRLAELMSIHDGRLTRASCNAIAEFSEQETAAALVELRLSGVLIESEQRYGFAHGHVRLQLSAAVEGERRIRAHSRLGESLLIEAGDPIDALQAAVHLFRAGATERCEQLVREAVRHFFDGHRTRMHVGVPLLEQVVALYRTAGHGPATLCVPLAALGAASFFVDRRLANHYGEAAVDALEAVLRFDLARGLRRTIGAKPALYCALAVAAARRHRRGPDVKDALRMLAGTVVALGAVATSGFDLALAERCRSALDPLEALGARNPAGFVRECTLAVAAILTENHAATLTELRRLATRMDDESAAINLPEHIKREFLGGCLFAIGIMESWRLDETTLQIADRIEPFSPMYALDADHLRAVYYSCRGDMTAGDFYRQRVETRGLQVGAAWQVVTLGPISAQLTALWTHDAELAKRSAAEIERLSRELPALRHEARRARATYLLLCDRPRDAIETMQGDDAPKALAGWTRGQGLLARAHNRLGEHERARELCRAALAGRSEEDLTFVLMNLHVQLECVIADAALGDRVQALERLDALFARHAASAGPLALGALHETRVRLALLERDIVAGKRSLQEMRTCYERTKIPSLFDLVAQLEYRLARAEQPDGPEPVTAATVLASDDHWMTRLHLILTHSESFERRAQHGLEIALELTGAHDGFLISPLTHSEIVYVGGSAPSAELVQWAEEQLRTADQVETLVSSEETQLDTLSGSFGELRYVVVPLRSSAQDPVATVGLALGFKGINPRVLSRSVLEMLTRHLTSSNG